MALAASQNSAAAAAAAGPKKKAGTLTVVMTGSKTASGAGSKLAAPGPTPAAGSGMAAASRKGGLFYWGSKDLASAAWAMSVMGQTDSAPFVSMWAEMLARGEGLKGEGEVALTQVWQVSMCDSPRNDSSHDDSSSFWIKGFFSKSDLRNLSPILLACQTGVWV